MSFSPSSIPYGQTFIKTWRDPNGFDHHEKAIQKTILVRLATAVGGIGANQTKEFPLNLGFHFQVLSIWVDAGTTADDSLTFQLKRNAALINEFILPASVIPFEFPHLVLDGTLGYSISITPKKAIDDIWIFINPLTQLSTIELVAI